LATGLDPLAGESIVMAHDYGSVNESSRDEGNQTHNQLHPNTGYIGNSTRSNTRLSTGGWDIHNPVAQDPPFFRNGAGCSTTVGHMTNREPTIYNSNRWEACSSVIQNNPSERGRVGSSIHTWRQNASIQEGQDALNYTRQNYNAQNRPNQNLNTEQGILPQRHEFSQQPLHNTQKPRTEGCKKNTKASIKISGLNISGIGNPDPSHKDNKWNHVNQLVRDERIGILVIGETHLDETRCRDIETLFSRRLCIFYSKLENNRNAAGVAIVLNKELTNINNIITHEVVPGRALLLETNWHGTEKLSILGTYAPNQTMKENEEFWEKIQAYFERNRQLRKPDIMLGDFNVVEDPLDRIPLRHDDKSVVDSLDNLKVQLQLIDGWQQTYPQSTAFTFYRKQDSHQARLDRIYIKHRLMQFTFDWKIQTTGIKTDHRMVSVRLSCETAPEIGKGRWTWPQHLIKDTKLTTFIFENGQELHKNIKNMIVDKSCTDTYNPQALWMNFKKSITTKARERAKIVISRLDKKIQEIEAKLEAIGEDPMLNHEERILSMAVLTEKLTALHIKRHTSRREHTKINNILYSESINKYWTGINKD